MNTNSPSGVINCVPIIGIQYEVETRNGGSELQVEYLALNPQLVTESLCDEEDISLTVLWDLIYSGINLFSSLQLRKPKDDLLLTTVANNDHAKMFFSALNVALESEIVDKLIVIKDIKAKSEYRFDGLIM
jgi:hypothetical protein